jgi:hypothetical protein
LSHIVQIKVQINDLKALGIACQRLSLQAPEQKTVRLFNDNATGLAVSLPGWRYPVLFNLARGTANYDNFVGRWGEQKELDKLLQAYAVEKARLEARKRGHIVKEESLSDGSIKLSIQVAGGAA